MIAPVSGATVECSNSSLRFVKSGFLLLLFIHKDIALDYDAIIDNYAKRDQKRITFINPL